MKRLPLLWAILMLLFGCRAVHAQWNHDEATFTTEFYTTSTVDAHGYALSVIKEFADYQKSKNATRGNSYWYGITYMHGSTIQSVGVNQDTGMPELHNISLDDAFLLMYSTEVGVMLADEKRFDDKERAIASIPPLKLKATGKTYKVQNVPQWNANVAADTNCGLNRVRLVDRFPDKKDSLLHEMMHIATNCDATPALHRAITRLAPELLKLMRENPDMVAYLMRTEEKRKDNP